jgi:RNA-directed DNA polymerase
MNFFDTPLFSRLLKNSPLSRTELTVLLLTAPWRYKEHEIEKRNGRGRRLISQPTAELKYFQRLVIGTELVGLPIHPAATAYRTGSSIKQHALPHARARYLLKLDFKDFFPSLKSHALVALLKVDAPHFSEAELALLANILCRRSRKFDELHLSIGAPSSPFISNYVLHNFDADLTEACTQHGANYTRYADDIAISTSTPRVLDDLLGVVRSLMTRHQVLGLTLNETKTVNVSKKRRRTLTGLVLGNDGEVSVGREKKRRLRAMLHALSQGKLTSTSEAELRGLFAFLHSIDPQWVSRVCARHGFSSVSEIAGIKRGNFLD